MDGEVGGGVKKSPGRRRVVPYTISAAVDCESSFRAVRIPSSTSGRESIHAAGLECVFNATLNCRWKRSIMPFVWG